MEKRMVGFFLILSLVFAACGGSDSTEPDKVPVPPSSMFMVRNYHFCPDEKTDRFLMGYYGNKPLDTLIYFYIVVNSGDTIYQDQWPSKSMLPSNVEPSEDAIVDAMNKMLDTRPVIGEVCGAQSTVFTYSDHTIGYCESEKSVVEL